MTNRVWRPRRRRLLLGQAAIEALLVTVTLALALLVSWHGGDSLALQLQHAVIGYLRGAMSALALA